MRIGREKTEPQARTLISLWFLWLVCMSYLYCDWSKHSSWDIASVHGFPGRTVITITVHCLQDLKIKVLTEQEEFQKFVYKHAKANHHLYNYIHPHGWDYFKVITLSLCYLPAIYLLSYISRNGN